MTNLLKVLLGLVVMISLGSCGYNRIDAGHAGIKVNLYGDEKGVDDVTEVTGAVWYNPFTTEVYEVPTFVQNAVYTRGDHKGSYDNEEFRVTTKNGLVVAFDVSINYLTPKSNVVQIFKKYRKPVRDLEKGVMRNYLRDAFNSTAAEYTASQLYESRNKFQQESEDKITEMLGKEGFVVEQVVLLNELRLPESVVKNIEAKVNATQMALRKKEELQQATADAQKKIASARGDSASSVIRAAGEAAAYKLKQKSLTDNLIKQQFIDKWDGKLPMYGEVPQLMRTVTK